MFTVIESQFCLDHVRPEGFEAICILRQLRTFHGLIEQFERQIRSIDGERASPHASSIVPALAGSDISRREARSTHSLAALRSPLRVADRRHHDRG